MLGKIIRDFMFIWATVGPIGSLAFARGERRRVTRRATIYAAIILDAMGVLLLSLKLAGGIILFLFSLQMLFGNLDSADPSDDPDRDIAIFPLAVPSIAGPGTIMAVIVLTDTDAHTIPLQMETAAVLLFVSAADLRPLPRLRAHPQSHRTRGRVRPRPRHGDPPRRPFRRARHEGPVDPALGDAARTVVRQVELYQYLRVTRLGLSRVRVLHCFA